MTDAQQPLTEEELQAIRNLQGLLIALGQQKEDLSGYQQLQAAEGMRRIMGQVPRLLAEVERLRDVLEGYAEKENWGGIYDTEDGDGIYVLEYEPSRNKPWLPAQEALGIDPLA